MRPKKIRWVKCFPGERCFRPQDKPVGKLDGICLTVDEFEAVRLADLEELTHAQAGRLMQVSRPTFTRILAAAHKKIADGFVNIKAIKIEGGCCRVAPPRRRGM
ncbi:MAG: DUF134 domain-containing protein [Candidatus Omnitrophica bacterium]|nr:DUF134 domain-containing protein [Candidatus Omnitrophota bacterium]MDE2008707.1 DUF134 domain-containing protein [Candidatus Omnitrophota bacterium]MDE2214848.1 DUF134 domain-containing protein [Candidatus Omnitrophota bacterium]MDE2231968.1 DUF134 domain-containing protein [Candidatus Omnitrophota bacterium]